LDEVSGHSVRVVCHLIIQTRDDTVVDECSPVASIKRMLVESVNIHKSLLTVFFHLTCGGVNCTSNTDLLFLDSLSFIGFLKSPNFVNISTSSGNLILVFKERILGIILDHFGDIVAKALVQPTVVDLLGLLHQWLDTID
jgi:hypothetical protein